LKELAMKYPQAEFMKPSREKWEGQIQAMVLRELTIMIMISDYAEYNSECMANVQLPH